MMRRYLEAVTIFALTTISTMSISSSGSSGSVVLAATYSTLSNRSDDSVRNPTAAEIQHISDLLERSKLGQYPGTDRTRHGKHHRDIPVWTQRTAILHYNRKQSGSPLMWLTLAMGTVSNARNVISNKKLWMDVWEQANPGQFAKMKKYLPKTWSDIDSFESEMGANELYVYKPVLGFGGEGISFERGADLSRRIRAGEEGGSRGKDWVVQEFIYPFLYNGKKTHMRPITLLIVQPDGSREFYMYHKMRVFTAAEDFDEGRLLEGKGDGEQGGEIKQHENAFMLLSNMHQNKIYFERDPNNKGKEFKSTDCVLDAERALRLVNSRPLSFEDVFRETKEMHSIIYSIVGELLECKGTDVSIYDDACFHIMASDVAFDKHGKPYFLEMNNAMAYSNVWTDEEQSEFSYGAAALIRGTASPFKVEVDPSAWQKI